MSMNFNWVNSGRHQLAVSVDCPAGEGPWPVVMMAHGLTGNRLGKSYHFVEFARRLNERGIACVRFDQAGCGESTGAFVELTIPRMVEDCQAIRTWAVQQKWANADRLGWVGVSLGALAVVAADAEDPSAGVALWAPVYDMPRVFGATAKTGLRALLAYQGWVPYRGLRIGKQFVKQLDAVDTSQCLAQSRSSMIVFHSKADDVVDLAEGRAYHQRCEQVGRACEMVESKTADHDFTELADRDKLLGRSVAFFTSHLL